MILITKEKKHIRVDKTKKTKQWLENVARKEGKKIIALQYVICTDRYILKVNKQYLGHNYATDIITFDLGTTEKNIEGEIYISFETVRGNAKYFNTTLDNELKRVMVHGLLHLCGYNDIKEKDKATMRAKEDLYLSLLKKTESST